MAPRILPFSEESIAEAARLVLAGRPVAVPTETVYGLAGDATSGEAVAAIYAAKGRPSFNPLIVHVANVEQAAEIAVLDDPSRRLADRFWPGPLTLVLPARDGAVASLARAGLPTIAVRVPAHRAMHALLETAGRPLAAPSANASGGISPTRADHVAASLPGIDLVIDDGPTALGLESTIVRVDKTGLSLLRPGPLDAALLAKTAGVPMVPAADGIQAPGQLASHYAPGAPLRLGATEARDREWLIGFGPTRGDDTLSAAGDLTEAAARLFDALHRADRTGRPIAVASVPEVGLGVAINDRLRRAAA